MIDLETTYRCSFFMFEMQGKICFFERIALLLTRLFLPTVILLTKQHLCVRFAICSYDGDLFRNHSNASYLFGSFCSKSFARLSCNYHPINLC